MENTPRAGEIFYLTKDKPYQIITMGIHKETCESMVIYQALFGEYKTFVLPLSKFMEEITGAKSKIHEDKIDKNSINANAELNTIIEQTYSDEGDNVSINEVNQILISFLDADSYSNKLEVITTNIKAIDNRLINDMAASLDCTVDDGPIEQRIHGLIYCLKQLSRFEVRRR